jgi:parvulin-like peptidyl-prolyl isomerase
MSVPRRLAVALCVASLSAPVWAADPVKTAPPVPSKAAAAPVKAMPAAPAPAAPASAAALPPSARAAMPFAHVGDTVVSGADYQRALAVAMRKKYYHAKPPEAEYAQFQREVGEQVVDRVLLLAEARRRGVQPDREKIDATVAGYEAQYKGSANWATGREKMLAAVVPQLENESLLERLERSVRDVPPPGEDVARAYYEKHKELFVEPEQLKVSVIVLKVDPSSPQAAWNSAKAEAESIHRKLLAGANFGDLARLHSGDRSAASGGEMDYAHRGMLPEVVHGVVDQLAIGALTEPIRLLEGYVLLRLDGRRTAEQRSFEQVRARAGELWQRDEGQARWKTLLAELRKATQVRIDESHYAPLRGPTDKRNAG